MVGRGGWGGAVRVLHDPTLCDSCLNEYEIRLITGGIMIVWGSQSSSQDYIKMEVVGI